ncbi:GntR family transcriptional regulator [Microvirga antarctica]|uniref:GntR family transcriptional regulator n=1 Tax=Microvirga antarctica TaxID=2819233 RepID=UPI001B308AD5|nr:GntR family transcriptional regulator [Microvirga antarctica]
MLDLTSPFLPLSTLPQPKRQTELAVDRLRQAIVECHLHPGSYVSEAEAASRYGLGRAAVRVALTALSVEGFVARQPRQGWRITAVSEALIADVIAGRRRLETAFAARRLTAQEIAQLDQLTGMVAVLADRADRQSLVTARVASRQVKETLAAGLPPIIRRWLRETWDHAARIEARFDQGGLHLSPPDHGPLVIALACGNEPAAERWVAADCDRFCHLAGLAMKAVDLSHDEPRARSARRWRTRSQRPQGPIHSPSAVKE